MTRLPTSTSTCGRRKEWKGTCRQLEVKLDDGTVHIAYFKFT